MIKYGCRRSLLHPLVIFNLYNNDLEQLEINNLTAGYNADTDCIKVYYNGVWYDCLYCGIQSNDLIPVLTSNIYPSGTASASSEQSGNAAFKAFDGDTSTYWCESSSSTTGVYVQYEFENPVNIKAVTGLIMNLHGGTGIVFGISIKVSENLSTWNDVYSTTVSFANEYMQNKEITFNGNVSNVKAVRLVCTSKSSALKFTVTSLQCIGK